MRSEEEYEALIDMIKRLAAGWDQERVHEFGSERTFPAPKEDQEWHHWDAMPEVVKFLKERGEWPP